MRIWPKKGPAEESRLGPATLWGASSDGSSAVMLRKQRGLFWNELKLTPGFPRGRHFHPSRGTFKAQTCECECERSGNGSEGWTLLSRSPGH